MSIRSPGVMFSLALGLAATASTACSSATESVPDTVGEGQEAILDGFPDDADKAVVGVYNDEARAICTGSLIAPNVVLTARHCVSKIIGEEQGGIACSTAKFVGVYDPAQFFVTTFSEMMGDQTRFHPVREVVLLPAAVDDGVCGNDQAILILSSPISDREAVPLVPRIDVAVAAGEPYYAVGYGSTGDSPVGAGLRRRRNDLFVDCVAADCEDNSVLPTEWIGDIGACQGDSGGPSVDLENRVIGVISRGTSGCDGPIYGAVVDRADWLQETTLRAAALGGYEPPLWATGFPTDPAYQADVGSACQDAESCPAHACFSNYCTRPCNELAACPDGYTCEGAPGFCAKNPESRSDKGPDDNANASCSVLLGPDPTKPVPWIIGAAGLGAMVVLRRRRYRAPLG